MSKTIQLEATGEFPFVFYIEKAVAGGTDEEMILEGVASTTNIDHDNERMSKEALDEMANLINEKSVPLRVEHSKSENAIIGRVFKGWVDERNQLHIQASLDKSHPVAPLLYSAMKNEGKKMGFSVGGLVKRAAREFSEAAGKLVKTFYDVELKEVSVTPRPANYDAWAISKSIAKDAGEAETVRDMFYDTFLFENPKLDYLQVFAKSVPDEAWRRVETTINKTEDTTMTTDTEVKEKTTTEEAEAEKATETEVATETEKAVSRTEFNVVVKGIETMTKAFAALASHITKDREGQENEGGNGSDLKGEREKSATEPTETEAEKATETETEADKCAKEDETEITRSISTLEALTKKLEGIKKTETPETEAEKATETDETEKAEEVETETAKGMHPLDQFVSTVTKTIQTMADQMEKSGMTMVGFEKSMVDRIVNDKVMQEEIQKMATVPGAKKSVSLGVPYMVTKPGKRFALTAQEVGAPTIEKSRGEERTFKSLYKSEYSSVKEDVE